MLLAFGVQVQGLRSRVQYLEVGHLQGFYVAYNYSYTWFTWIFAGVPSSVNIKFHDPPSNPLNPKP